MQSHPGQTQMSEMELGTICLSPGWVGSKTGELPGPL